MSEEWTAQHWNVFGHCPACKARPGEPCRDQRRAPRDGARRIVKRAHRFREQLRVPLLPGETRP